MLNKIKGLFLFSTLLGLALILQSQSQFDEVLQSKVDKAIALFYEEEEEGLLLEPHRIEGNLKTTGKIDLSENLFAIKHGDEIKGYAYVDQAPSMKNVFDYLVIIDKDWQIQKAKVLIYREQHGRQIGSSRWLSQFIGMTTEDRPELGNEVDGISGATISSRSMTNAVHDLLATLDQAKKEKLI